MSEEEVNRSKKERRGNPLDIDYSLKIGTSVYHVLGKRQGRRRGEFDYYVMDDKLIRSQLRGSSRRPRYIVDEPTRKKKPRAPSPKLTIEEIQQALAEVMESEREKIVDTLRDVVVEENEATTQADEKRNQLSVDLIKNTMRETLAAHNESLTAIKDLEKKLVNIIAQEISKILLDSNRTQQELKQTIDNEKDRITKLFADQKETFVDELQKQQGQAMIKSINNINEALKEQKQQQQEVHQEIETVNKKLDEIVQQISNQYANIRIANDLDPTIPETLSNIDQAEHNS